MIRTAADTQAIIWFLQLSRQLSAVAKRAMEQTIADGDQIAVSAMSIVEMVFLSERGRIAPAAWASLAATLDSPSSTLVVIPIDRSIAERVRDISRALVTELPDRVIAATAVQLGVPLITSDLRIRASGIATIW